MPEGNALRIILFDVEHGFCAFIRTPNGHTILIDCGKGRRMMRYRYLADVTVFHVYPAVASEHNSDEPGQIAVEPKN